VDEAKERGASLVEAWVVHENAPAVAAIAADDDAPAPARKAARRGLNVLKSRGVAVPDRRHVAVLTKTGDIAEAWFRPPDGAGTSAFTLGSRSTQGRYRLADVIVKEGVGLVSIAAMQMSRTQLRETFDGIARRFGCPPVSVPIEWARARIAEARRDNEKSGTPLPLGLESHRDLLGPSPKGSPPHPAESWRRRTTMLEQVLERSAKLHAEPEIRSWLPDPASIQSMLVSIGQSVRGEGAREPGAVQTKVREVIEKSTDTFFTGQERARLAQRMKDAAISVAARGAYDQAADLLATEQAVRTLSNDAAPHDVPFLRAFFEKAFGLATARAQAQRGA